MQVRNIHEAVAKPLYLVSEMEELQEHQADVARRLLPTYEAIRGVQDWVSQRLEKEGISESQIHQYLEGNLTLSPHERFTPAGLRFVEVAMQYESIKQVNETTFMLKRWLIENNCPERTVAYQLGTGFPLPETDEKTCILKGFLPYEEDEKGKEGGVLRYFGKPGEAGHSEGAGMYVYEITSPSGQKSTLLALKGREHGYANTNVEYSNLWLARMSRVLKGVGTEFILTTFASGVDVVNVEADILNVGDYGILMGSDDLSGLRVFQDPGAGRQDLVGDLYGGPFGTDANRRPDKVWYRKFIEAINRAREKIGGSDTLPKAVPVYLFDTLGEPHFQTPGAAALARMIMEHMKETDTLPEIDASAFGGEASLIFATVQGMSVTSELADNFRTQPTSWGGHPSIFNRTLPTLPVDAFTDHINPRGGSQKVSHIEVMAQGARSAQFIAPVIRDFFCDITDQPWVQLLHEDEARIISTNLNGMKEDPMEIADVKDMLERKIKMDEELAELYRAWGIQPLTEEKASSAAEVQSILPQLDVRESRIDYDYFIRRRNAAIQIASERLKQIGDINDEIQRYITHATQMDLAAEVISHHKDFDHELINIVQTVLQASQA